MPKAIASGRARVQSSLPVRRVKRAFSSIFLSLPDTASSVLGPLASRGIVWAREIDFCFSYTSSYRAPVMHADKSKPRHVQSDGSGTFTISNVEVYCAGRLIADPVERLIASLFGST